MCGVHGSFMFLIHLTFVKNQDYRYMRTGISRQKIWSGELKRSPILCVIREVRVERDSKVPVDEKLFFNMNYREFERFRIEFVTGGGWGTIKKFFTDLRACRFKMFMSVSEWCIKLVILLLKVSTIYYS